MILESADTAFFFGHSGQDAIMGCDNCGRRIESVHTCMVGDVELCRECFCAWALGYLEGQHSRIKIAKKGWK